MSANDPECQQVLALTKEWIQCVADKNVDRVRDLLTDDFIYIQHPSLGGQQLSKQQILDFMPSIEESDTHLAEQFPHRFGDVIVAVNITQANQKVDPGNSAGKSFLRKKLIDSSSWRKVDGAWQCFDYRLIDAVDV
jgi:ketosteroid isomerase-like protein